MINYKTNYQLISKKFKRKIEYSKNQKNIKMKAKNW